MRMLEFNHPIPVVTEDGQDGYAIYVTNCGSFENDIWCVALCKGGHIRHYTSAQLRMHANATLEINKGGTNTLTHEQIIRLVRAHPNDAELGEQIRLLVR